MLLALYVARYFCFKKGFHRNLDLIWFNKIFLSKIVFFLWEINRLDESIN